MLYLQTICYGLILTALLEVQPLEIKWEQNQHRTSKLILSFDDLGGLEDRGGQGAEVADKA
jgi:hypothetical protein